MILIDINMPENCGNCDFCSLCGIDEKGEFYKCLPYAGDENPNEIYIEEDELYKKRPDYCPLIELPTHGRLIDANALARFLLNKYWDSSWISPAVLDRFVSEIANAPTIIPAELEEKT